MRTRLLASIIIFFSAYSPLAIILAIKDFDSLNAPFFKQPIITGVILVLATLSLIFLRVVIAKVPQSGQITIRKVSNCSNDLVNYSIPYLISFLGFKVDQLTDMICLFIFMILLCFLTIRTQSVFINPILALWGYGLYDVEFDENGITKGGIFLTSFELKIEGRYCLHRLSRFMFLITQKVSNNATPTN